MVRKQSGKQLLLYMLLAVIAVVMTYPLLWLVGASFKTNREIFGSLNLLPSAFDFSSYSTGWKGTGQFTFTRFFTNTFALVIPMVIFALISNTLVAYGFARFKFPLKGLLFSIMISTLMLPSSVTLIPNYILFRNLGWLDSYLPFFAPAITGSAFFTFLLIQFYRGLPKELDESAKIDGCGSFKILYRILMPLSAPSLFSIGIFQFIWVWNDFFNQLIYIIRGLEPDHGHVRCLHSALRVNFFLCTEIFCRRHLNYRVEIN
jgi:oligogalacturonide transport system permease protein